MKKSVIIIAAMIAGTVLFAQKATEAVPGSQLRKQYDSEKNQEQIKAIKLIKEEASKNKVLSVKPEPVEDKAESAPVESETPEQPKQKKSKHMFGPGVTKVSESGGVSSLGVSPVRMLAAVVILILAMGAFFFFLKKFSGKITGAENNASLRVKARLQLDNKNSVVIVGAYEQEFMLGVGTNGVNLISKFAPIDIGDAEEEAGVRLELSDNKVEKDDNTDHGAPSFEKKLKMAVGGVDSEDLTSLGEKR